jgi:NADPH:quinone reductase-like Zn-dependent oxidoreductase
VVRALDYGTTGLSVGRRVFGPHGLDPRRHPAEYVAVEARNLAPLPGDVDFTVGASLPISPISIPDAIKVGRTVFADLMKEP